MALKLNLPSETYKCASCGTETDKKFREYLGSNVEQMPLLTAQKRIPVSFAGVYQRKLEFAVAPFEAEREFPKSELAKFIEANWEKFYQTKEQALADWNAVKTAWMNNYLDTGDLKAQKGDEVKLVLTTYADGSISSNPAVRTCLSLINPQEELIRGAVNLGNSRYESIQGKGIITTKKEYLV